MTYDGLVLAAVVAELQARLARGRVQKIRQHNDTDLTIEIRGVGHTFSLFLSVDSRYPRVYLTASRHPSPQTAPQFCMVLRKYAQGAMVNAVEQVGMDRVMRMRLDSSEHGELALILEIMGKHSNLILIDANQRILGAAKHVGSSVSRYRQVLPGRDYLPPPGADKADIRETTPALFEHLWRSRLPEQPDRAAVRNWLVQTFAGFGPFIAEEIVVRAAREGAPELNAVSAEALRLGKIVLQRAFEPVLITDDRGTGVMAYPVRSVQVPDSRQHSRESIGEALDTLYRSLVSRTALEEERTQLSTAVRRALAARKQALKSIERTLAESGRSERYKQLGEILISNLHAVERGATLVRLADYFDPQMTEVDIELDEKLTPQENAERYFKRYQKARDAAAVASARREQTLRDLESLSAAEKEVLDAASVDSVRALRTELTGRGLLRSEAPRQERGEEEFGGHRIRRIVTADGWEILYGETSQANDHLTQRIARPNDVWLHARAVTGAHVIIRTAGHSGDVPRPVLDQAASIAARNSQARHSSLVPVDHTLKKHVRKPRGSAPGFVIYSHEKTIDVGGEH